MTRGLGWRTIICSPLLLYSPHAIGQERYPSWGTEAHSLKQLWEQSPLIAAGSIQHVRQYGVQHLDRQVPGGASTLYWCSGTLQLDNIIKGTAGRNPVVLLWATIHPECKLEYVARRGGSQIWFLRKEGGHVRLGSDIWRGKAYFEFKIPWTSPRGVSPEKHFGELLLAPHATSSTGQEFVAGLWAYGDLACELLGEQECTRTLRALAVHNRNQDFVTEICSYLKACLGAECK